MNHFFRMHFMVLALVAVAPSLRAQTAASPSLQEQLEAQYPLAKMTAAGGCQIAPAETVLVIQKPGIGALPEKSFTDKCSTQYKKGKVESPTDSCTGFGKKFGDMLRRNYGVSSTSESIVMLERDERVYPIKLEVDMSKDEVKFDIGYCAPAGNGRSSGYKGQVDFKFEKNFLKTASVPQVTDVISQLFSSDTGGQQQQEVPQAAAQAPMAQPPTVEVAIGQTIEQVQAAMGQPVKRFDMGVKQIYVYKDVKITFVDGKVAEVQ